MRNDRKVQMPPHCGNCIFLDWGEDYCHCIHPSIVDEKDIEGAVREAVLDADFITEVAGMAEDMLDDAIETQDWQQYDNVCDHHRPSEIREYFTKGNDVDRVRNKTRQRFIKRVHDMVEKGLAEKEVS